MKIIKETLPFSEVESMENWFSCVIKEQNVLQWFIVINTFFIESKISYLKMDCLNEWKIKKLDKG